jgi:omega-amidase
MKIAIIQSQLFWENPSCNRKHFEQKINSIQENVDLIILPEMFTSGFTMNPETVAETMTGETIVFLKTLAKAKDCAITGSLVISENNNFYNRMVFVFPDGNVEFYDKKHLFTLAGEDKVYTSGNQKKIVEFRNFKICLQICYDLRFPTFARNIENYDVLIYVANWPKTRINAWDILLKARAVENMCYTIGVNRVGVDNNNLDYIGHSQVNDYLGKSLIEPQKAEGIFIINLDKVPMLETRKKLGFLNDRD